MAHENLKSSDYDLDFKEAQFHQADSGLSSITSEQQSVILRDMKPVSSCPELPDLTIQFDDQTEASNTKAINKASGSGSVDFDKTRPERSQRQVVPARAEAVDVSYNLFAGNVDGRFIDAGRDKLVREDGRLSVEEGALGDPEKFQKWVDTSIPRDGTQSTDDKRTALVIETALKNASQSTDDPVEQVTNAYVSLNGLRFEMRDSENSFSSDPAIANAEHFLETAHRVAGEPFDGVTDGWRGQLTRGAWSAPAMEAISHVYNVLKQIGVESGSSAENQHKWETSGIDYGMRISRDY